jgi:hypothetical protein
MRFFGTIHRDVYVAYWCWHDYMRDLTQIAMSLKLPIDQSHHLVRARNIYVRLARDPQQRESRTVRWQIRREKHHGFI